MLLLLMLLAQKYGTIPICFIEQQFKVNTLSLHFIHFKSMTSINLHLKLVKNSLYPSSRLEFVLKAKAYEDT